MTRAKRKPAMTIFLTVVVMVAVTLVALNFVTGEKKIDKRLQSLYAVSDPQFLHSMGSLLGPGLYGGNRVTGLSNGDEIFPQMLAAIRSAQKTITSRPTSTGPAASVRSSRRLCPNAREARSRCTCSWTGSAAPAWTATS